MSENVLRFFWAFKERWSKGLIVIAAHRRAPSFLPISQVDITIALLLLPYCLHACFLWHFLRQTDWSNVSILALFLFIHDWQATKAEYELRRANPHL